jgi:hypothetical protein
VVVLDLRSCLCQTRRSGLERLVGSRDLRLQFVELRIVEDRPPISAGDGVARLGGLPGTGFLVCLALVCSARRLFIVWSHRNGGLHILRPNHAAAEQRQGEKTREDASRLGCGGFRLRKLLGSLRWDGVHHSRLSLHQRVSAGFAAS